MRSQAFAVERQRVTRVLDHIAKQPQFKEGRRTVTAVWSTTKSDPGKKCYAPKQQWV
jgi:hypothetical protein